MIETRLLTAPQDAPAFVEMTFPHYKKLVFSPDQERFRGVAVGAWIDGVPAGLALGAAPKAGLGSQPELLSLFTDKAFRNQGVGGELMETFHQEMSRAGCGRVQTTYMGGKESTLFFERILEKTGWGRPQPRMAAIKCDLVHLRASNLPWLQERRKDSRFAIIGWNDVTSAQKDAMLKSHAESPWVAEDLMPSKHEKNYDVVTSCAVLKQGELVGWVINHLMPDGTTRFTCSYAHPRLQKYGIVFWLYKEASDRMDRNGRRWCMWTVPLQHPGMHAFATRWMKPYSLYFRETLGCEKILTNSLVPA